MKIYKSPNDQSDYLLKTNWSTFIQDQAPRWLSMGFYGKDEFDKFKKDLIDVSSKNYPNYQKEISEYVEKESPNFWKFRHDDLNANKSKKELSPELKKVYGHKWEEEL